MLLSFRASPASVTNAASCHCHSHSHRFLINTFRDIDHGLRTSHLSSASSFSSAAVYLDDVDIAAARTDCQQPNSSGIVNRKAPLNDIKCDGMRPVFEAHGKSSRRRALLAGGLMPVMLLSFPSTNIAGTVTPAKIDLSKAPTHPFDAGDERLREAASLFQKALSAPTVEEEESLWTEVIDKYGNLDAEWVSDIVSRAWGNRGNSRSRQGKMEEALADFDRSIELAPYAADPVLNRGVTLESLGRYEEAAADYEAVLLAQPNDPAAWNNLGNVKAASGLWDEALSNYRRAVQIAPEFSFAAANYALILYQVGKENEAFKQFRSLLRKYPEFPDVRAALAVTLYAQGLTAEAETNWGRVEDLRYRDRNWVRNTRKWPPRLVKALEGFLDVKAVAK